MIRPRIAIVDHSFHKTTRSTIFLFELFEKHFDVEVFYDEGWQDQTKRLAMGGLPLRGDFEWVVFLQMLPPADVLRFLKCKKVLFIPMLDGMIGLSPEYFAPYRSCYFLSFSKTLHDFLSKLGFRTHYLQYFPEPATDAAGLEKELQSSREKRGFFWQRRDPVNSRVVKQLLGRRAVSKLHIHRKADPGFEQLDHADEDFSDIKTTTSTWFDTREEFFQVMMNCDVFFAPREYEGIGMSFLEAMSFGKCVVSPDRPTANEYIKDRRNGILYDPNAPSPIEFGNIDEIRLNTLRSVEEGRNRYIKAAQHFIEALSEADYTIFGEPRLAKGDVAGAMEFRAVESLEIVREYSTRPSGIRWWIRRFVRTWLCFCGYWFARSRLSREEKAPSE